MPFFEDDEERRKAKGKGKAKSPEAEPCMGETYQREEQQDHDRAAGSSSTLTAPFKSQLSAYIDTPISDEDFQDIVKSYEEWVQDTETDRTAVSPVAQPGQSVPSSGADQPSILSCTPASDTEANATSLPPSDFDVVMAQYDDWFRERDIDIEDVVRGVEQRRGAKRPQTSQQCQRKLRKLGVGLARRPLKTKEEKKREEWVKEIEEKRDEMRYGPRRHIYAPHLDILYDYQSPIEDDYDSD